MSPILLFLFLISSFISDILSTVFSCFRFSKLRQEKQGKNKYKKRLLSDYFFLDDSNISSLLKSRKSSCNFYAKIFLHILLAITYLILTLVPSAKLSFFRFKDVNWEEMSWNAITFLYFLSRTVTFAFGTFLFYNEFIRFAKHTWIGLRFFWISNGALSVIKLIGLVYSIFVNNLFNDAKVQLIGKIIRYTVIGVEIIFGIIFLCLGILNVSEIKLQSVIKDFNYISINNEDDLNTRKKFNSLKNHKDETLWNISEESNNSSLEKSDFYSNNETNSLVIEVDQKPPFKCKIRVQTNNFYDVHFNVVINDRFYRATKKITDVIAFNEAIFKCYKKSHNTFNLSLIQQAYNFSLTLNPNSPSFVKSKNTLLSLSVVYMQITSKSHKFLYDLLHFLKLKNNVLYVELSKKYKTIFDEYPPHKENSKNTISNINELLSSLKLGEDGETNRISIDRLSISLNINNNINANNGDITNSSRNVVNFYPRKTQKNNENIIINFHGLSPSKNDGNFDVKKRKYTEVDHIKETEEKYIENKVLNSSEDNISDDINDFNNQNEESCCYSDNNLLLDSLKSYGSSDNKRMYSKDIIKKVNFINDVLVHKEYFNVFVVENNAEKDCLSVNIKVPSKDKSFPLELNISSLKSLIFQEEFKETISQILSKSDSEENLEKLSRLLTYYMNDLFNYDENFFRIFNLNSLLNLDVVTFSINILHGFFQLGQDLVSESLKSFCNFSYDFELTPFDEGNQSSAIEFVLREKNEEKIVVKETKDEIDVFRLFVVVDGIMEGKNLGNIKTLDVGEILNLCNEMKTQILTILYKLYKIDKLEITQLLSELKTKLFLMDKEPYEKLLDLINSLTAIKKK